MVALIGFTVGAALNRMKTADFLELVNDNKQLKYYALYSSRLVHALMSIVFTTIIGQLMQIGT